MMKHNVHQKLETVTLTFLATKEAFECVSITGDIEVLTGYAADDFLEGQLSFNAILHADDTDLGEAIFSHSPQSTHLTQTFRIIKKNGLIKIIRGTHSKQFFSDGDEIRIALTLEDPMSLSEDVVDNTVLTNMVAMMETTDDYIYFKDRNHVFTGASQTLVNVTDPTEHWTDLIGKTDYDVFPSEYADIYFTLEKKVFSGLLPVAQEIQPTLDKHGNKGWVDNRKYPIKDDHGEIIGLFGIARDITRLITAEELAKQAQLSSAILNTIEDCVITCDAEGKITLINRASRELYGFTELPNHIDDLGENLWFYELNSELRLATENRPLHRALRGESIGRTEMRFGTKRGVDGFLSFNARALIDAKGNNIGAIVTLRDITKRKLSDASLKLAASVFTHAREGIMITDATGALVEVNETFTRVTGYSRAEVIGKNPRFLQSGLQGADFFAEMWKSLIDNGYWAGEVWNCRKGGEVYAEMLTISAVLDTEGITQNYVALFSDITQAKHHQQELEHIAHYDALTNLPNRVLLSDRLQQAMMQSQRRGQSLAVVYLDLDGFKAINDLHGHDIGDALLIALAQRMKTALREGDTLARIGGDEFIAVLADLEQAHDCEPALVRLLNATAAPVMVGDLMLQVSSSIGVTMYPQDGVDAEQLIRHADQAMYQAKQAGKNRYHLFDVVQDIAVKTQRESLEHIRQALDRREFVLYYQPKVNMKTGTVIGVEALIRWQHPERGLLAPAAFLPVIEDHPISVEIGEWVIETALKQMSEWQTSGVHIPVSVNVGARQLQQDNFVARLSALLAAHVDVKPENLELEVLETSAMEDIAHVSQTMNACRELGVHFALDDFGTGYSSLTYLKRLPVDMLKIDQSFVRDMVGDTNDLAIIEGVIGLAKAFKRDVIAEGVETIAHGLLLLPLGCVFAQGYGIARPMPAVDIPGWVSTWRSYPAWVSCEKQIRIKWE